MRFIKYDAHFCLSQALHIVRRLDSYSFQSTMASTTDAVAAAAAAELSAVTQAEGKLKVDPSIGISDMQAVVEAYLQVEGSRNFQKLLDIITKEGTSWTSRPKVCLL